MRDYDKDRETYNRLIADIADAEVAFIAAKDAVRRLQLEIASEIAVVGDVVQDHKGELRITKLRYEWMRPDDARRSFGRPSITGVRRNASGAWGRREVNPWGGTWSVVKGKEQADAENLS